MYVPRLLYLSSVNEHLGCFCVLAVVNSASVNTEVYVLFQISGFLFFFFRYIPRVEFLGHMVVLFLVFEKYTIFNLNKKTLIVCILMDLRLVESRDDIKEDHRSWYTSVTQHLTYP